MKKGHVKTFKIEKNDIYQMITDLIISKLECGVVMWHKPWGQNGVMPMNYATKTTYSGFNSLFLGTLDYEFPYFMTFKQANELGGSIKKGERGYPVIYRSMLYFDMDGNRLPDQEGAVTTKSFLKYFTVFNVFQIEGIDFNLIPATEPTFKAITVCENVVNQMQNRPKIDHKGGNRAFYKPSTDSISMPIKKLFNNEEEYYSTLFHELVHSTGHTSRLNREELVKSDGFGKTAYSKEELTAEFGASFLCALTGISNQTIDNSAAYINSWIKALKNDKTLLITAATKGQKAANYILNTEVSITKAA